MNALMDERLDVIRGDAIIVKYVRIDGQNFENPLPRFEYAVKIGTWCVVIDTDRHAKFFVDRDNREVEVEVGMHFGTLRDVGVVKTWRSELDDGPAFVATVTGSDPMHFVER
jgi:hypothetical protein